jgi:hypothetical protein
MEFVPDKRVQPLEPFVAVPDQDQFTALNGTQFPPDVPAPNSRD